ncbi:hypothetical protein HN748_02585 [Candidatus Peregrinibacteria bacterium]|jgi:hypothetical protein|nr:hypothetical protein [Candidatus Peregrinibacteria bacterium]MBT7703095.1 hypothetical protein [Candidatus Peregrinibacteria bacterium]
MKCTLCKKSFEVSKEEAAFCGKMKVPTPAQCPTCCQRQLFALRNEQSLYQRPCDCCKKPMIAMFPEESPYTVYCSDCWWNDQFEARDYGQEFDFSRPFFDQLNELMRRAPIANLAIGDSENSDFTNYAMWNKNCYLISSSDYNQDCYYSTYIFRCADCADCLFTDDSELCYESIDSKNCYGSAFLQDCSTCTESFFCFNCRGAQNLLGCVNVKNQNYQIFNKKVTKEEFEKVKNDVLTSPESVLEFRKKFYEFKRKFLHRGVQTEHSVDCVGDRLTRCKGCVNSFDLVESQDCLNCSLGFKARDCMNSVGLPDAELCYGCIGVPGDYNLRFCVLVWPKSSFLDYSLFCRASSNCFGCVGLHKNEYCILNKQYTREEYEKIVPRIIEHMKETQEWGQFLPPQVVPFAYNETLAQDYFPLNREQAEELGYRWQEESAITAVEGALSCRHCESSYQITEQEKRLYGKLGLPKPDSCPKCRHKIRIRLRNPRNLWERKCSKCSEDLQTSFSPQKTEPICCERCYLSVV